jgi:mannose-6-phosphate isomerase-like protein (cupin superfamily)
VDGVIFSFSQNDITKGRKMSKFTQKLDRERIFATNIERHEEYTFSDTTHAIRATLTIGEPTILDAEASHYIVVCDGEFQVSQSNCVYRLHAGFFGSFPGFASIEGSGRALILSNIGYRSPTLAGGPIEDHGRLRYVDGCTASLLLPPPVRGEPCLNFMHLPRHISQTMHTHPSLRAGVILSGNGQCETLTGILKFHQGTTFFIPPNIPHSFQSESEPLRIAIFHPDSDSGPTHTDHTMLNRTFIQGESARFKSKIHTASETQ